MFTGIVQAMGRITEVAKGPSAVRLVIDPGELPVDDVAIGDSIAVGGCCLTVVAIEGPAQARQLGFDVSAETLACTAGLDRPGPVNLEMALRLSDRLGGHLMTGHVDGVGTVVSIEPVGDSRRFVIAAPRELAPYLAPKGSITVDGISLTVNEVSDEPDGTCHFALNIIPHTAEVTTIGAMRAGDGVNLVIDVLARYLQRMQSLRS